MSRARAPHDGDILAIVEGSGRVDSTVPLHRDLVARAALAITARQLSHPLDTAGRAYAIAIAKSALDGRFQHAVDDIVRWNDLP